MAKQILVDLDLNNIAIIVNVSNPTASGDVATKAYVDSVVNGMTWKNAARVKASTNISTATPGATVDGVSMVSGDRVLLTAQITGSQNGI